MEWLETASKLLVLDTNTLNYNFVLRVGFRGFVCLQMNKNLNLTNIIEYVDGIPCKEAIPIRWMS